jgi:hypothetical protein
MNDSQEPPQRERRRLMRRVPSAGEPLSDVRLRTGRHGTVVDLADNGVLIETAARLLPGTHVDVHVVTAEGRVLVRSRVVRACVCHLAADCVRYRGALAFERDVDTAAAGYPVPAPATAAPRFLGTDYPTGSGSPTSFTGEVQ